MIVYIDMDDTLCDFKTAFVRAQKMNPQVKFPQSIPGFFENLSPLKGAISAIQTLIDSDLYEPYILTAPSTRNPRSYMEKRLWIEKHFDYAFVKKLIISPDKSLLKGGFLIDDNIAGKGQELFEGSLIHFGSLEYPDWNAVMDKFKIKH